MFSENAYLQELIEKKTRVTLFLMNGFQLRGTIVGTDQEAILFHCERTNQMIYKHAISTVKYENV